MAERIVRIGSLDGIHIYDDNEFTDGIDSEGPIKAPLFKNGAGDGTSATITVLTDVRMSGTQLQKRTRSLTISGGILTSVSAVSAWTNTTDI